MREGRLALRTVVPEARAEGGLVNPFTVTINVDGARLKVEGEMSPYLLATAETPASGGLEDVKRVYLLDANDQPVELPAFLQETLDERVIEDGEFDDRIEDAIQEALRNR